MGSTDESFSNTLFFCKTQFTKFVSEKIATVCARHASGPRRIPMPANPRHRARCDRHEARAGIVALMSCCLRTEVWAFLMTSLSHPQRARSEVFAVVPLQRAAMTR